MSVFNVGDRVTAHPGTVYYDAYKDWGEATVSRIVGTGVLYVRPEKGPPEFSGLDGICVFSRGWKLVEPSGPDVIEEMFS